MSDNQNSIDNRKITPPTFPKSKPEKEYVVREFVTNEKVVTKEQYHMHLTNKLNLAVEKANDLIIKRLKLEKEISEQSLKIEKITEEIVEVSSVQQLQKDLSYASFRYAEFYPKKAKLLSGK